MRHVIRILIFILIALAVLAAVSELVYIAFFGGTSAGGM